MRSSGIAVVAVAALVTACGSGGIGRSPTAGATSAARTVANFIGKGLQTAQDDAQADGFNNLTSHDATGRARYQIFDRDWKVCFQTPAAGTAVSGGSRLDFGVVKLDESCPATDQGTSRPRPHQRARRCRI